MASGKAPPGTAADKSRKLLRQISHQSSEGNESSVSEELELLTNVYFDELDISYSESGDAVLKYHLTPSTADDKDKQFVYLDLTITLSAMYPNSKPEILFGESRGLSDAHLRGIAEGLHHKSQEHLGSPMVYELVEYAKDCLTDNNRPCGQCAICQFDFEETDDFTKTECYHYFHLPCLASYVEFFDRQQREGEIEECRADLMLRKKPKQLECPVCREPIAMDTTCLDAIQGVVSSSATDNSEIFRPSEELQAWQAHMASLLRQQREKGGMIDPSREDDTIDETWVSSGGRKKTGEDSKVEEQQLQEQERREEVRAVQHMSGDDATSHIHPVDIQSLDGGSEHPPPSGKVPSESKEDIYQGSDNSVRTQHVIRSREKQTDSRSCLHSITSNNGSESRPQNDNPDSKSSRDGFHSRSHYGSHSRSHDRSHSRQHDRSHSRPHDGSHSRQHDRSHSRPPHDGSHSRQYNDSRPHDGSHSRQHDRSHSRPPHDGSHSRQYNDSRPHDGSHSRQHAKPYKGPHSRPEYRSGDPRRDYKNSQQSAGRRQTDGSDLPIGSSGDHRRRDRRRYHHVQDENHQCVHSNQPTNGHHPHRHRDSRPEREMPIGTGKMVNEGLKEEGKVSEGRKVTKSEETSRVEPSSEQLSLREQDSQRHVTSGRNEHRGSSHKTRESGYPKSHWSRGRAEKRGQNKYQECVPSSTTEK